MSALLLLIVPALGVAVVSPSTAKAWIGYLAPAGTGSAAGGACRPEVAVPRAPRPLVLSPGGPAVRFVATVTTRAPAPGPLTVTLAGLPTGVTGAVTGTVTTAAGDARPPSPGAPGTVTVTGAVVAGEAARAGSHVLRLEVRCGDEPAAGQLPLRLLPPATDTGLTVLPTDPTVSAGEVTGLCLRAGHGRSGRTAPGGPAPRGPYEIAGLPPEAETAVLPSYRTDQGCARLSLRTAPGTPAGEYPLTVTAGTRRGRAAVQVVLHVQDPQGLPFTATGAPSDGLRPGRTVPLDVAVTNPNPVPIRLSKLSVTVRGLDAAHAAGCPVDPNVVVTPFGGDRSALVVPAHGRASLSSLGLAPSTWPRITLLDTGTNRSACTGAVPWFLFTGTADPADGG